MPDMFFQPTADGGQRLYLHHRPAADVPLRGALVYVHPWAEEMNKSRRMVAMAARAFADAGWAVLQVDLQGCGDSSGDFADATWDRWLQDTETAARWIGQQHAGVPLWLWGLRTGALLCAESARTLDAHLLFWQPVQQGRQALQQFLRLKAAAQLADGGGKAILESARAELAAGRHVHVGGYELGPELAAGLERSTLAPQNLPQRQDDRPRRLVWLELSNQPEPTLSPAAQSALPKWEDAGWHGTARAVDGPPFWQTTEIETAPALIHATLEALAMAPVNQQLAAA